MCRELGIPLEGEVWQYETWTLHRGSLWPLNQPDILDSYWSEMWRWYFPMRLRSSGSERVTKLRRSFRRWSLTCDQKGLAQLQRCHYKVQTYFLTFKWPHALVQRHLQFLYIGSNQVHLKNVGYAVQVTQFHSLDQLQESIQVWTDSRDCHRFDYKYWKSRMAKTRKSRPRASEGINYWRRRMSLQYYESNGWVVCSWKLYSVVRTWLVVSNNVIKQRIWILNRRHTNECATVSRPLREPFHPRVCKVQLAESVQWVYEAKRSTQVLTIDSTREIGHHLMRNVERRKEILEHNVYVQ